MPVDCCTPCGCTSSNGDEKEAVRVACNNDECTLSGLMHRQCFDQWEQSVLQYLKSCGRARSWSEKQRYQNLWTKKGYDLAFKACACLCGRGHLRKDMEAPKKCGRNRATKIPIKPMNSATQLIMNQIRNRANSLSSTGSTASSSGYSSPPESHHQDSPLEALPRRLEDRERRGSGNSCLFVHRADFSAFNALPRHKINSFHVKMEDEGSYGNDDIRCFILSNLAMAKMSKTFCVICQSAMQIYDRYPLIDGTFFLSPKQYSKACIPVTVEGQQQHLSAVCMSCLEGWSCTLSCRSCRTPWNGSSLILGTMYSYDVFSAVPCCPDRLKCNQCNGLVVQPDQRSKFFSHYSRALRCPHCSSQQHHFVKPLPTVFQLFRKNTTDLIYGPIGTLPPTI